MSDDRDRLTVEFPHSGDEGFVVAIAAIAVKFDEIGDEEINPVERVGALGMAGDLCALPGTEMGVELFAKFGDLNFEAFEFGFAGVIAGEMAKLLNIFFEAINLFLAFGRDGRFFVLTKCAHYATI